MLKLEQTAIDVFASEKKQMETINNLPTSTNCTKNNARGKERIQCKNQFTGRVFCSEFNLSLNQPRKDACTRCEQYNSAEAGKWHHWKMNTDDILL